MSNSHKGPNRRSAARIVESFRFKLGVDGFELEAEVVNLSTSGLLCFVDRPIPPMTRVLMALVLPSKESAADRSGAIKLTGAVVRSEKIGARYQIALFFQDIDSRSKRILERFVTGA